MFNTEHRKIASSSIELVTSRSHPSGTGQAAVAQVFAQESTRSLFDDAVIHDFSARWDQVQGAFVDDPQHAVELADAMINAVVKRVAEQVGQERAKLEMQWSRGENMSAEELRRTFIRYRAMSDRLLAI